MGFRFASIVTAPAPGSRVRPRAAPDRHAPGRQAQSFGCRRGAGTRGRPLGPILGALALTTLGLFAAPAPLVTAARAAESGPDPVAIRAASHAGYGRLVFDWPGPIRFERTDAEGAVIVRFARPFAGDLAAVPDRLADYLDGIERTADGRGVRLRLLADVRARLSQFEPDLVVVDLEREGGRVASEDAGVSVRTGEHEGFTRIVFDWPGPVAFRQQRDGRDLTLLFDRRARIDAVALGRRLQAWLQEVTADPDGEGTRVRLRLEPGLDARAFTVEETRVVVDLLAGEDHAEAGTSEQANRGLSSQPARTRASGHPPADEPADGKGEAIDLGGVPPDAGPAAAVAGQTAVVVVAVDADARDDGLVLTFTWARPVPAAVFIRGAHLWTVFDASAPAEADFPPDLGSVADAYLGPAEAVELEGGTALRFPLSRALDAAVTREGAAWRIKLGGRATDPQPVPVERFGEPPGIRLDARTGGRLFSLIDPAVGDRLTVWPLLDPGRGQPETRRLVDLELIETAQGAVWRPLTDRLEVALRERGIEFGAPGGLFLSSPAVPAAAEAEPEAEARADGNPSADADARAAAPGEAPADEVVQPPPTVAAQAAGVDAEEAQAPARPASRDALSSAEPAVPPDLGPPLGLSDVAVGPGIDETARRRELIGALERAPPEQRARARLDLARFYLARALAPETLAVLRPRREAEQPPSAAWQLARRSLSGAAELLMGHLPEATAALETPALDGDREVALWRAVLAASRKDWPRAAEELERSEHTLETYPPALQVRLGVPAALIAVENGDSAEAFAILDRLAELELHQVDRARVGFVLGLAHARAGSVEQADRIWRRLERGPHDETRIKASYARATMRLDAGLIEPRTALAELEAARPVWRGHPWELTMLDGLAQVRVDAGDPAGAIRVWQEALQRFPEAGRARHMADAMQATFRDALVAADGHALDPLRALALYRDFPELMPKDEEADRLRRRLAARLATLDLVEPAAELLGTLIRDRPGDLVEAEVGADLAALWLRARDAEAMIDALEKSRPAGELPDELAKRRQLLRARAFALSDRPQAALEILGRRQDPPAQRLRLAIHWRDEAWSKAARAIEALLGQRAAPDAPLAEDEQVLVIRLAIAHARRGDAQALERLRARYGPVMRGRPGEPAFLVATMTRHDGTADTAAMLAAAEDRIGRLEDYLTDAASAP